MPTTYFTRLPQWAPDLTFLGICSHMWTRGRAAPSELFPLAQLLYHLIHPNNHRSLRTKLLAFAHMSHTHLAASSSSKFQLIVNNALKAYEKRTKTDLLAHPLAVQLQACNSPGDILAILQQQVQGLDQSRSSNDRWTKWLDPTVSVLYALSETLGEGVALVSLRTWTCLRSAGSYIYGRYSLLRKLYLLELVFFS